MKVVKVVSYWIIINNCNFEYNINRMAFERKEKASGSHFIDNIYEACTYLDESDYIYLDESN